MHIQTVMGEIQAADLGACLCHEHVLWNVPEADLHEDPDLGFDSIPAAVAELRYLRASGGNAVVEMSTAEIGRSAQEMKQISAASDVHIIAATGRHKDKFNPGALNQVSVEELSEIFIRDVLEGMDSTGIKAGVIKAATSLNQATPFERRVIQAAGEAHRRTGAPVSTHTEAGTFAVEQVRLLMEAGVEAQKLLVGHLDRNIAEQTIFDLAKLSVFLGFDQIGKNKYWPDHERVGLIRRLWQAGYGAQIVLSTDSARKSSWHTHNPAAHGPALIFEDFLPALKHARIEEEQIHTMLVENPARFLAF